MTRMFYYLQWRWQTGRNDRDAGTFLINRKALDLSYVPTLA